MRKLLIGIIASVLLLGLMSIPSLAIDQSNLLTQQWRIFNVKPDTASYWDINKVNLTGESLQFPIQQFNGKTTGSFAVYLMNNYNVDITDKTFSASMSWTPGPYETRSTSCGGAHVRFWFQDVTSGPYTSSDYWWNSTSLDLNTLSEGSLTGVLSDRSQWTNMCGQSATDEASYAGPNCVGGTDPAISPYDGFTKAMKDVKQLGLSFGSDCRYASGVALVGEPGTFTVSSFTITP